MANKKQKPISPGKSVPEKIEKKPGFSFKLEIASLPWLTPYIPGILLFLCALIVALLTYNNYGISWDEAELRDNGLASYNYIFNGNNELFTKFTDHHGMGFELLLVMLEKLMRLQNTRDIYLMRHLVTHVFFIVSVLAAYVLIYRLFKNRFIASLGFIMLAFMPRLYAHSFFNTRDLPFLSMFLLTLTVCQAAFAKNKPALFFITGILCGYATSIRILGIMLGSFILFFLMIDLIASLVNKEKATKTILNILLFSTGFLLLLYLSWPYLWKAPIHNFAESFKSFSHYDWTGFVLVNGKYLEATKLPWTYFPSWFLVTNPELWLAAGFAGMGWICVDLFKKPLTFLKNSPERNFLLYLLCFAAPVMAVIILHSVMYDDWRHLYFIYPCFVLMGLYFISKMLLTRYKLIVQILCGLQIILIGFFMIGNAPNNQVYFNNFVSHAPEYLREHYDLDYWGCSFKQGLDHLLETNNSKVIKVGCDFSDYKTLVDNNIMLLPEEDRKRIQYTGLDDADYLITNFREHPYDYPSYNVAYSISVLNSTILCVYKLEKDAAKQQQFNKEDISILNKAEAKYPDFTNLQVRKADAYFYNGQYDSAEVYARLVLQKNPTDAVIVNNMARIYFVLQKYPRAIDLYARSIQLSPYYADPYVNIAACFGSLGKYDSAVYYLNKAISIDPGFHKSYENLAITYKMMGQVDSEKKYEGIR